MYHCVCVSTIIPLSVSTDTTIPSTTTTHTITGIDNRVDNSNTYYTVMTTTIMMDHNLIVNLILSL